MEGEESLSRYSPEIVVKTSSAETIGLLPLIVLMHGTEDYSIPSSARFVHVSSKDVCLSYGLHDFSMPVMLWCRKEIL